MKKPFLPTFIALGVLAGGAESAQAQTPDPEIATNAVAADNSKSNKLDQSNTVATADAQKDDAQDRVLTQRIRQSVMADKSLSTYAHNVKIVSINGTVTLNGVVRSDQERSAIESKAISVAGPRHVVNDLKVTPGS